VDKLAEAKLPLWITELSVHELDENKKASALEDVMHAALMSKINHWLARNQNHRVERHVYPWTVVSVSKHHKHPTQRVSLE
jgi:hypothetical protein